MFSLLCKMCLSILIVHVVIANVNVTAILLGCDLSGTQQQHLYNYFCGFFSSVYFFEKGQKRCNE